MVSAVFFAPTWSTSSPTAPPRPGTYLNPGAAGTADELADQILTAIADGDAPAGRRR